MINAGSCFKRNDLHTVSVTNMGCLVVYPPAKKSRQKAAIGDHSGKVIAFSISKHHEVQVSFETPPVEGSQSPAITKMTLFMDQLFAMSGARLNAYSKKGKNFFGFDTNVTETIRSMYVSTPYIYAGGEYVMTSFQEATELGFYMCPDRINDIIAADPEDSTMGSPCDVFLGCQDRTIRLIRDNTNQIAECNCESPITTLAFASYAGNRKPMRDIIYGTSSGSIGAFEILDGHDSGIVRKYAAIPTERRAAITGLVTCDINSDGAPDIIVGRDDGSVEIHSFSGMSYEGFGASPDEVSADDCPLMVWKNTADQRIGECITGIKTGAITCGSRDEILVSTYSGKVISFSPNAENAKMSSVVPNVLQGQQESLDDAAARIKAEAMKNGTGAGPVDHEVLAAKIADIRKELVTMEKQLNNKASEYSSLLVGDDKNGKKVSEGASSTPSGPLNAITCEFHVRSKWELVPALGSLMLQIETDAPIDHVALQSDLPLELHDDDFLGNYQNKDGDVNLQTSNNNKSIDEQNMIVEMGSPQLTKTGPTEEGASKMLCVIRPSSHEATRLEIHFRPHESICGTLRAIVTPKTVPRTSRLLTFPIHALSLHERTSNVQSPEEMSKLPLISMKMTGNFTERDAHAWIYTVLPGVSENLSSTSTSEPHHLFFRNSFIGTVLHAKYRNGEAEFLSENVTTLSILKKELTKEATSRKISVRLSTALLHPAMKSTPTGVIEPPVHRTLRLLYPILRQHLYLAHQLKLIDGLTELDSPQEQQQGDIKDSYLSEEYQDILARASQIRMCEEKLPKRAEYLKAIVVRLFCDRADLLRGEGAVSTQRIKELGQVLDDYNPIYSSNRSEDDNTIDTFFLTY